MAYDGYGIPQLNFAPLAQIPQDRRQAQAFADQQRIQQNRERTLAELGQGAPIADVSRKLFAAGDVEGGLSLARLADAQAMREYTIKSGERDYDLRKRTLDATLEGNRMPPGFQRGADGRLQPVPGGPQDPAYLQQVADAKQKPRDFSVSDITKLSEEGGKFSNLAGFKETFQEKFAGYGSQRVGEAATFLGRNMPGLVSKDTAEAAQWWQGYDRYKNTIRNELFGSALTANEQAAFERADINPGMDPKTITANLEKQQEIAKNGLKRKANALIQAGYPPEQISASYGLDLKELGVTATGRAKPGGGSAPPATAPAPKAGGPARPASKADYDALPSGATYMAPDGSIRTKK